MALILLVEDEKLLRWGLRRQLELRGHMVCESETLAEAEKHLREHRPEIVVLDIRLPDGNGLDFMAAQKQSLAESAVIVVTASGQVESAVTAMKLGAFDFLAKPLREGELLAIVDQAVARAASENLAESARREQVRAEVAKLVANSEEMTRALGLASKVASSASTTVLLQGETGSGKEVVARHIHTVSPRAERPLLPVNCAALPESLVESELFGHEKGAFTDAREARKGIFELAHGGTVILDEIGELPLSMQVKLLRFLEERSFRRIGSGRELFVDVRVLALTNRNLEALVGEGKFRGDLFYRLNVFPITIPPLRARRDDIVPLAVHFLKRFGPMCRKSFEGISADLQVRLVAHDWPGNVRELRNVMEFISIMEPGGIARGALLPFGRPAADSARAVSDVINGIVPLAEVELTMIRRAMQAAGGNQSEAARLLGISRDQVRYRVKRYREDGRWPEATSAD